MIITQDTKPKKGHGLRKSRVIRVPVLISVFSKYGYQKACTLPINKMTSVPPSVIMNKNGRSASISNARCFPITIKASFNCKSALISNLGIDISTLHNFSLSGCFSVTSRYIPMHKRNIDILPVFLIRQDLLCISLAKCILSDF